MTSEQVLIYTLLYVLAIALIGVWYFRRQDKKERGASI